MIRSWLMLYAFQQLAPLDVGIARVRVWLVP